MEKKSIDHRKTRISEIIPINEITKKSKKIGEIILKSVESQKTKLVKSQQKSVSSVKSANISDQK